MMNRTNWILLIVLVIQVLVILIFDNPWSSGNYRGPVEDTEEAVLFPEFRMEAAAIIKIEEGPKTVTLAKNAGMEGAWYVETTGGRYKADRLSIDSLLSSITRLKRRDVVSRRPDRADLFEVDEAAAVHLAVSDSEGEKIVQLRVGKSLGALRGTYVKVPGQDEVYLQMENIRRACVKGDDWVLSWRDRTVFSCEKTDIKEIEILGPGRSILLKRCAEEGGKEEWRMASPKKGRINPVEGDRMAESLSDLKARDFVEGEKSLDKLGLVKPELVLFVTLARGEKREKIKFSASPEREGTRYLMKNDDPATCCRVANHRFYSFLLRPEELLEKE